MERGEEERGQSVNQGGHLNMFRAFRAVGDWSSTTLNVMFLLNYLILSCYLTAYHWDCHHSSSYLFLHTLRALYHTR
jgi:hypothetical protein